MYASWRNYRQQSWMIMKPVVALATYPSIDMDVIKHISRCKHNGICKGKEKRQDGCFFLCSAFISNVASEHRIVLLSWINDGPCVRFSHAIVLEAHGLGMVLASKSIAFVIVQ